MHHSDHTHTPVLCPFRLSLLFFFSRFSVFFCFAFCVLLFLTSFYLSSTRISFMDSLTDERRRISLEFIQRACPLALSLVAEVPAVIKRHSPHSAFPIFRLFFGTISEKFHQTSGRADGEGRKVESIHARERRK